MTEAEKASLAAKQAADKATADKKAADDAAAQDDDSADDKGGSDAGDDKGDDSADDDEESVQLKADLARETKAREKAEKALAEKAFKDRKGKREKKNDDVDAADDADDAADEADDKPLTQKQLDAALARERDNTRRETLATEAVRIAQSMSSNETMQQLVLEKWKNRTFPADLSLQDQIEECFLAANKKRILGENNELKRALLGKKSVNKDGSGTHQEGQQDTRGPKGVSPSDSQEYAKLGFKWNPTAARYEKKLANGKLLVRDIKTKKTSVI